MAGFSKNPAILFAMFAEPRSISDPAGVDMSACCSVLILFEKLAFFYK